MLLGQTSAFSAALEALFPRRQYQGVLCGFELVVGLGGVEQLH